MTTLHDTRHTTASVERDPIGLRSSLRPDVAEFVALLEPFLGGSTLVVVGDDLAACGLPGLDVLLVDGDDAIGVAIDVDARRVREHPAGLSACYVLDAVDLAVRSEDALYLLSRWHPSLFREGASIQLARWASDSALLTGAGARGHWVQLRARNSTETPVLIERITAPPTRAGSRRLEAA